MTSGSGDRREEGTVSPGSSSPSAANGPIYIVGLDRSGKTTIRAYLASHSRISIPAVGSNLWTYFDRRYGRLDDPQNLERCLTAMGRYKHVQFLQPSMERIRAEFAEGPRTYGRLFSLLLMHHAERQGKQRWGAQSGLVEQYADDLFAAYPGLKVIHMVRDPRDRYEASLAKWPKARGRAGAATARWRYSMAHARRSVRRYGDDYLVVRFEDLVRDTESTIREVCAFLGEEYEPAMLELGGAEEFVRSRNDEPGSSHPAGGLSSDFVGLHEGRIATEELRFMELHAGRLMRRYGYEPGPADRISGRRLRFWLRDWPDMAARMAAWTVAESAHRRWPRRFGRQPGARMIRDANAGADSGGGAGTRDRSESPTDPVGEQMAGRASTDSSPGS